MGTKLLLFKEVLDVIEKEGLQERVTAVGQQLWRILEKASAAHPDYVSNLRGVGTILAFDCSSPAHRDQLANQLRNNGVLVGTNGTQSIRFRPALNFSPMHVKEFQSVFSNTLEQISAQKS